MELLQLLKTLNDQSGQVNMMDQVELLNEAVVALNANINALNANINTLDFRISCTWWVLFLMMAGIEVVNLWWIHKLDKRTKEVDTLVRLGIDKELKKIKKIDLAGGRE